MTPEPPVHRRPDGTAYGPSRFNVRQYEEQYGPGGVPEGYSMAAITPLQSPAAITVLAVILVLMTGVPVFGAFVAVESDPGLVLPCIIAAVLCLLAAAWGFIMAGRRRRWLRKQDAGP